MREELHSGQSLLPCARSRYSTLTFSQFSAISIDGASASAFGRQTAQLSNLSTPVRRFLIARSTSTSSRRTETVQVREMRKEGV